MQQVIQPIDGQLMEVAEVPVPFCGPHQVLIANHYSVISAGTEKSTVELAKSSLLSKARQRPDHVRRVLEKVRQEGLSNTIRQVRAKLAQPMPLGYASAGVVLEVGSAIRDLQVGDRVASNGPHAGVVSVSRHLVAQVPETLTLDRACYAVIASIALQGVRLARVGIGDVVLVIGLGLIGQLAVAIAKAAGTRVLGIDPDPAKHALAKTLGADEVGSEAVIRARLEAMSMGQGADAVLIAASTENNGPIELAAQLARQKGRIVAIGAIGMQIPRREFYPKELEFVVSCSYGPGRYDVQYEDGGIDYPYAHVRWTEQRNIAAALQLMADGRLPVEKLTTHQFSVENALDAYQLIETRREPFVGVVLTYPPMEKIERRIEIPQGSGRPAVNESQHGLSVVGAGSFAASTLVPSFLGNQAFLGRGMVSAGGLTSLTLGRRYRFAFASTDLDDVLCDTKTTAVAIATRHHLHTPMALAALRAGKAVFLEKPLAITEDQLEEWLEGLEDLGDCCPMWTVGFNRRYAPPIQLLRQQFKNISDPKNVTIRFNAGSLPPDHWTHDPDIGGGRLIGEACHAIDLATYLVGAPPTKVFAASAIIPGVGRNFDDRAVITLRHADQSVSSIVYTAGGDRSAGKERIEVFGGQTTGFVDDYRNVAVFRSGRRVLSKSWWSQQKGYKEQVAAFANAIKTNEPPIPYQDIISVTSASLRAVQSLRLELPLEVA